MILIIKTKDGYYDRVKEVIKENIDYENFIGQLEVDKANDDFSRWLDNVVK